MKKFLLVLLVIILALFADWYFMYYKMGTTSTATTTVSTTTTQQPVASNVYTNTQSGYSLTLPSIATSSTDLGGYMVVEGYQYQELGPGNDIAGTKFTIPTNLAAGTNLSSDSYISVETMPQATSCIAGQFLSTDTIKSQTVTEGGTTYSVASSTGAGAGNRYEEIVYALSGTQPCLAVRYFIHYGVIGNYPAGTVKEFDEKSLRAQFDSIRHTLVIN
ncbi:MAG: hypothetical protein JWO50_825 [Candidatus Kaiserbacteria bacterium]|nr:hypothetical protein [Candidatus Kaiserbacteria bacterium]